LPDYQVFLNLPVKFPFCSFIKNMFRGANIAFLLFFPYA
jgi:hypothetical protein